MENPPQLTVGRFLTSWQPDVPALLVVVILGALYGWGVLRLRGRGDDWPLPRVGAFAVLGLGTLVVATMSALAVYDHVLFWPAAVQNVLLDLIAPLGLALGDPLRLALRSLPERAAGRVQRALTGRLVRLLTFPLVSTALVLATELTVYFTPYFATALRDDWLHEVMYLHLLLAGSLFVLPMLTREAALPRWCTHPVRAALVFLDGIIDAVPGIVVMTHGTLIAGAWYLRHAPSWAPDVLHDQQLGGGAMISIAELVALPFLLAILVQWARTERAETVVLDRRLEAELVPATPAPGAAQTSELVRPWWETENSEVAQRIRHQRPGR
ncbi:MULTISPECIES: cytochrome c oxidase assembly protein [Streptomyces]|uniref:Cytochrome c oxidase assembly protein n=1 Tax=Streptomyces mirabilis TaxID=68239 RepID=A0ABU3UCD8_9ACTN|nr:MULTISPECIES: cytochrome c oxidase assembly protein [Streptomyces]MCX4616627.1 cytochrome c oxidase assembly protein [Streptomyces mirabilis]MCX5354853.1 cytochrome c oxidase assembly protein [Streptomyces mirabilis]MDU8991576.1 cytochrome c oxidase assembly protein [Streptomyces mirabilis]QDN92651.1 cytochrome c oxidase assembly protein [Streptomyces sp. RLB3-6]QDO13472.1 cytochrome c oxidase assembly protein [Streptomyces sp. S1D4-23]